MLRIAKESQQVKGYVISWGSNGFCLVRYHSDYGVYTNETVLDKIECPLYPEDKGFKKAIEEAVRKQLKDLPKTLYIDEEIMETEENEEDCEFDNILLGDDGYGDEEDKFSEDMRDFMEYLIDNEDQ